MNLARLFDLCSPTTLASMILNIEGLGKGADDVALRLLARARQQLYSLVGEEEGNEIIGEVDRHVVDMQR